MTGNIMTAQEALKEYGHQFDSIRSVDGLIELRNSYGRKMRVRPQTRVYHRGHGRFAKYSELRDLRFNRARKQLGWKHDESSKPPIGKHRHQGDTRRSREGGYI